MLILETVSPLAAGEAGFPRRQGRPYLPGGALREAFLTAALAYAIRRDAAFAAEMRRLVEHGFRGDAGGLAAAMEEALLRRQPELDALEFADVELEGVRPETVAVFDRRRGEVTGSLELETFGATAALAAGLPPELETWLSAAARSYAEALATAEREALSGSLPRSQPFYQKLKSRVLKQAAWPLRAGYWTPDPQGGRFLALARLESAVGALRKRFDAAPLPRRILYSPRAEASLGWLVLRKENG
ncbi:hypothetical protein [Oceanithermus sp.]